MGTQNGRSTGWSQWWLLEEPEGPGRSSREPCKTLLEYMLPFSLALQLGSHEGSSRPPPSIRPGHACSSWENVPVAAGLAGVQGYSTSCL